MHFIPLLVVPFVLYNVFALLILQDPQVELEQSALLSVPMISGAVFTLSVGATIILLALVLLFFEVLKSTRVGRGTVVDHVLATVLFVVVLLEFLLVPEAATSTFFILMAIALIDLICGFAVSLRSASRDVTFS